MSKFGFSLIGLALLLVASVCFYSSNFKVSKQNEISVAEIEGYIVGVTQEEEVEEVEVPVEPECVHPGKKVLGTTPVCVAAAVAIGGNCAVNPNGSCTNPGKILNAPACAGWNQDSLGGNATAESPGRHVTHTLPCGNTRDGVMTCVSTQTSPFPLVSGGSWTCVPTILNGQPCAQGQTWTTTIPGC